MLYIYPVRIERIEIKKKEEVKGEFRFRQIRHFVPMAPHSLSHINTILTLYSYPLLIVL